jgi:hypothetical protein
VPLQVASRFCETRQLVCCVQAGRDQTSSTSPHRLSRLASRLLHLSSRPPRVGHGQCRTVLQTSVVVAPRYYTYRGTSSSAASRLGEIAHERYPVPLLRRGDRRLRLALPTLLCTGHQQSLNVANTGWYRLTHCQSPRPQFVSRAFAPQHARWVARGRPTVQSA